MNRRGNQTKAINYITNGFCQVEDGDVVVGIGARVRVLVLRMDGEVGDPDLGVVADLDDSCIASKKD